MPESFVQLPVDGTGKKLRTNSRGSVVGHDQYVIPTDERQVTFRGGAATFRTPGRAGTAGQKIFAIHNAAGSTVIVDVRRLRVDLAMTVAKAITVLPPVIRLHRVTVLPTNGTSAAKVGEDTAQTSNASVAVFGDASADGTSSTSALTATIPANSFVDQEYAPRFITAAGYEPMDRTTFLEGQSDQWLRAGEGLVLELVYTATGQNPVTDMWLVTCSFDEFTLPA
ncbi:MAG: hypothetical protein M3450_03120 [Actinomycetota bacterium]|nr:hypothetical protein [Actinomycetota bacterium]